MPAGTLTPKQALFVREYLIDLNATQAAIRAGYSVDTAQQIGSENLSKPVIQESIQSAMEERSKRTEITADRVLREIATIAFIDIRDAFGDDGQLLPIKEMPEDIARAIGGIDHSVMGSKGEEIGLTSKIKLIDKKGALELAGKHLKLFTDRVESSGVNGGPIEHKWSVEIIDTMKDAKPTDT
jgi:phage terminase small subunit